MGNQRKKLNARLGDYAAGARLATAATTLRGRLGNWPMYAAVAGSALAMSTSASASIITGNIVGGTVQTPGLGTGTHFNLATIHFSSGKLNLADLVHLKASSGQTHTYNAGGRFAALAVAGTGAFPIGFFDTSPNHLDVRIFASHSLISAGAGSRGVDARIVQKGFASSKGAFQSALGKFQSGQPAFAGMALATTQGLNVDYGWLQLEFFNGANGLPQTLDALSFGIETNPNTPIQAGETVEPTPEPGSMGLALLASGAFGVAALRRRKTQADEA